MLNINEVESTNVVEIAGILKELDVEEKSTNDGRDYVSAKAVIKVDQEINGQAVACEIPVRAFSMKLKSDGKTVSKLYNGIVEWRDKFTSMAVCPEGQESMASKVVITTGKLEENIWIDTEGKARSTFQISTNFMNAPRGDKFEEGARFELSGVVLGKAMEVDSNNEETGRLKVQFGVIGYNGKLNKVELIAATDNSVNYINSNWEVGDTVNTNGAISINQSTKTWFEEQGFGEPIKRTKTVSRKELIILGGSPAGLEEECSYDSNDVKAAIDERTARTEELKSKAKTPKRAQAPKNTNAFGF